MYSDSGDGERFPPNARYCRSSHVRLFSSLLFCFVVDGEASGTTDPNLLRASAEVGTALPMCSREPTERYPEATGEPKPSQCRARQSRVYDPPPFGHPARAHLCRGRLPRSSSKSGAYLRAITRAREEPTDSRSFELRKKNFHSRSPSSPARGVLFLFYIFFITLFSAR